MHSKYYKPKKVKTSYILERRECEISCRAFTFLCQLFLSLVVNIALDNIAFLLILVRVCLVQERRPCLLCESGSGAIPLKEYSLNIRDEFAPPK